MGNPAYELAELLKRWDDGDKNSTILQARDPEGTGRKAMGSVHFWHEIVHGVELVQGIEQLLNEMEANGRDIERYRKLIPSYYAAVFLPEAHWGQKGGTTPRGGVLSAAQINTLEIAADALATVPLSTTKRFDLIRQKLQQARDLVGSLEDDSLERHHLLWQIDQALKFVADLEKYGSDIAVEVAVQVIDEASEYADKADVPGEVSTLLKKLMWEIGVNIAASEIGTEALKAAHHLPAVITAITGS